MLRRLTLTALILICVTACQAAGPQAEPSHLDLSALLGTRSPVPTPAPSLTASLAPTLALEPALPDHGGSEGIGGPGSGEGDPAPAPGPTEGPVPSGDEGPAPSGDEGSRDEPPTPQLPASLGLDPADWHDWPVVSPVTETARQVYLIGQALGNDPHAFSVFGDCQSEPDVFMGVYETDAELYAALPPELQETVDWFRGSFLRLGPTVRPGTTTGAILWALWHRNRYTCTSYESPLQCELRIHKPSFAVIQVGSHYESRNQLYMRMILEQLIEAGVVPILSTKADNREHDEHVNAEYAQLAVEFNIPFWNFWAAVDGLPNRGLYTRDDAEYQGDLYFTDEAVAVHRLTALQALDAVRRAVMGEE